jgi:flagellar hook protein FlgE
MLPSLHNGISALKTITNGLQALGNNIANVSSLGYKSSRVHYSDSFYSHLNKAEAGVDGNSSNNLNSLGSGVHVSSISSNFNQGVIENTGMDLDLAIEGQALPNAGGFFEVADPNSGELFYTRAGAFESTPEGFVVTRDQYRFVLQSSEGGAVRVGVDQGDNLLARNIDQNGRVSLIVTDAEGVDQIRNRGQIKLSNFHSPQYLRRAGNGFYENANGTAGMIDNTIPNVGSNGKIKQFALELSNVDLTNEFAMMISHQRSFQAGSRVVTTSDAILSEAVNLKR